MTQGLRIINGKVYDPASGVDGQVRPILILDGRVVDSLPANVSPGQLRTIDGSGMVVMPGGVDIHCHIASSTVNRGRSMQGEEHATHVHPAGQVGDQHFRSGSGQLTPSTFLTGYRYAALGYTTAIEAAVSPSGARQTHLELEDTPNLDAGFLLLLANHQNVIDLLDRGDRDGAVAFIGHLLRTTGALGIKVVNPGGVESWRRDPRQQIVESIDQAVSGSKVTPRQILTLMADAAEALKLAHPPHVHCNRLGLPGNVATTLETLDALDGRRVHLTHLQFHAYGKTAKGDFASGAAKLVEYLDQHPQVSADVGQVVFGPALTLTGDTPLEYLLWKLTGSRYVSIESELEGGCGLMPFVYREKQYLHSLQWAIGMELMLMARDPWRMLLSTDHPNGGSFLSYPAIIATLMSKTRRDEMLAKAHPRAVKNTRLKDIDRQFTLNEIAIITRAGPARVLGLRHKGHLGPGADGDVTIYHDNPADPEKMFASPRFVIKGGQVLVEDGELRQSVPGRKFCAAIDASPQGERILRDWFNRYGSYNVEQFGLQKMELAELRSVASV